MNDVTIFAPLPSTSTPVVVLKGSDLADDGTALVSRTLFDRLVTDETRGGSILGSDTYDLLQVVAVRFDLCDRHLPGPCPTDEDGRLRLVFQPLTGSSARDVGFHGFYEIRNGELGLAIAALRDLASTAAVAGTASPARGPLTVNPALSGPGAATYATKLRAFIRRFAGDTRNVRLTMNAQPGIFAQVRWALRGFEKRNGAFVDMTMVGATAHETAEAVLFNGEASYEIIPASDLPAGIAGALVGRTFVTSDLATQRRSLSALAAAENPLTHTAETIPCFACHVSTVVTSDRVAQTSFALANFPERYTSTYDLSTAGGKSPETPRTIRALGYVAATPLVSQRVVNETAQTLTEIAARFP